MTNKTSLKSLRQAAEAYEAMTFAGHAIDASRIPQLTIPTRRRVSKIQAAVSPDCTYRLIKEALQLAEREICLYIYNIGAPYLIDLLAQAKGRGVRVRIMYDAPSQGTAERQILDSLGVEVKTAPSTGNRDVFTVCHQKFAVIDSAILLLGSANWVKSAIPKNEAPSPFRKGNREWIVRLDQRSLARWFKGLFEADWNIPEVVPMALPFAQPQPVLAPFMMPISFALLPEQIFDILSVKLTTPARVTPIISPDNYFQLCYESIQKARSGVEIEQQYIRAGGPKTEALLELLQQRKDQVRIRIITSPTFPDAWEHTLASMKAYGLDGCHRAMNIRLFPHLHNKGVIVDRKKVIVSSTNWSENSIARAREAGVLIESPQIAGYYAGVFDYDWEVAWPEKEAEGEVKSFFTGASFAPGELIEIDPADML